MTMERCGCTYHLECLGSFVNQYDGRVVCYRCGMEEPSQLKFPTGNEFCFVVIIIVVIVVIVVFIVVIVFLLFLLLFTNQFINFSNSFQYKTKPNQTKPTQPNPTQKAQKSVEKTMEMTITPIIYWMTRLILILIGRLIGWNI